MKVVGINYLGMGEEVEHDEGLLWDDQSWEFPILVVDAEKDCGGIKAAAGKEETSAAAAAGEKSKKRSGVGGSEDDHELHIWTERERRKKMRNMFSNLHALLPHIPPKADKSTIVDEAVNYIKRLQQSVEDLERRKAERFHGGLAGIQSREAFLAEQVAAGSSSSSLAVNPLMGPEYQPVFKTYTSPNVILNICGREGHINVCSMRKPGLLAAVCFVMEKHRLEVVSAQASSDRTRSMYMIHARQANGGLEQFQQGFPIEESFKQAAAEIMLWVTS